MADMKESFLLYNSFYDPVKGLSLEEKGQLWDAVFHYNMFGELIELPPVCQMAFSFMRSQFDRDSEKYQSIIDRNRLNGSKGGRPIKKPKKANGLTGFSEKPKKADTDTDTDTDTVSDTVSDTGNEKEEKKNPLNPQKGKNKKSIDLSFIFPEYQDIVQDWLSYKKEKGQAYKGPQSVKTFFNRLKDLSGNNPETARQIIDNSISNNYAGIFELNDNKNGKSRFSNRTAEEAGFNDPSIYINDTI